MGKSIIVLAPPGSGAHGGEQECTTCHRMKGANLFRASTVCNACTMLGARGPSGISANNVEGIRGKSGYSKHGKHQENYSATKYIKP